MRRLPTSERDLRLLTACLLWIVATLTIEIASFIPAVAPRHVNVWRLGLGLPSLAWAFFHVTVIKRMGERAQERWLLISALASAGANGVVLQITPATWAVLMNLLGGVVWAAYFLRGRPVVIAALATTAVAVSPVVVSGGQFGKHDAARMVVFLPVLWALMVALYAQKRTIDAAQNRADVLAYRDPLTGLANRRALAEYFDALAAQPAPRNFAMLLIDLDGFKTANKLYGHLGGDHALMRVATLLRRAAGGRHLVARIGGDQFVVLMPGATGAQLDERARFYRGVVVGANVEHGLAGVGLDASIGNAVFGREAMTLDDMLTVAERTVYDQKARRTRPPEQATVSIGEPPPWLAAAEEPASPGPRSRLRRLWFGRPLYARAVGVYWTLSSLVVVAGSIAPGADVRHRPLFYAPIGSGALLGVALFALAPRSRGMTNRLADTAALIGLAGTILLTGGADSFALPLVTIFIVFQAWFWSVKTAGRRLLAAWAVILSPLLYDHGLLRAGRELSLTFLYTSLTFTGGLALVLAISTTVLIDIRRRTRRLALIDPLTGIANRRAFADRVTSALAETDANTASPFALALLDLDSFKLLNKRMGHSAGDALLRRVADALVAAAGDRGFVARTGGDEFAVLLPAASELDADAWLSSLASAATDACRSTRDETGIDITASAGMSVCPSHGRTLDALMRHADAAMMAAKPNGGGAGVDSAAAGV